MKTSRKLRRELVLLICFLLGSVAAEIPRGVTTNGWSDTGQDLVQAGATVSYDQY